MMGYDVEGDGEDARFMITQEGARLTATYGNEHVDPAKRTNRYLDDAIGPERYARVVPSYLACVARNAGRSIRSRRCRTPTARTFPMNGCCCRSAAASAVEQIVGSFKAISIEGGFKVNNLMGLQASSVPVILVQAVIDR